MNGNVMDLLVKVSERNQDGTVTRYAVIREQENIPAEMGIVYLAPSNIDDLAKVRCAQLNRQGGEKFAFVELRVRIEGEPKRITFKDLESENVIEASPTVKPKAKATDFACEKLGANRFRISWAAPANYKKGGGAFRRIVHRDVNEDSAQKFCKRWGITFPSK